jgi:drug/metabolite transporter (DMT)-like permease
MINACSNYPYFLSQLTTLVYVPVFLTVVAWERSKLAPVATREAYTPEVRTFPKTKFLVMGAFDSLAGVLALFAGVHTSGSTQALLSNSVIPMTMVMSIILLSARYRWTQYVGATIILGGVSIVILPNIIKQHDSSPAAANPPQGVQQNTDILLFNILFLISAIPSALSSVYKELAFRDSDADIPVNYLQAWVALFQLLIGLMLIPLNTLSFLGDQAITWEQLPQTLGNGAKCLVGINSITTNCGGGPSELQCDACAGAWFPVLAYMLFNLVYNVAITLVIKYASAALMFVVLT